jgi:hypothetical protein
MTVCCQTLTLGALFSRSVISVLTGAVFKKFGLFLNTPHKREGTQNKLQTPVIHPEETIRHSEHGEILKSIITIPLLRIFGTCVETYLKTGRESRL